MSFIILTTGVMFAVLPVGEWIHKNIPVLVSVLGRSGRIPTDPAMDIERQTAHADGTFIQWWLVVGWDDEMWSKELAVLKEAGMNYIILTPAVIHQTDNGTDSGTDNGSGSRINRAIYPTSVPAFETMKQPDGSEYPDVIELCLRNAREFGIKVFIGMNFSDEWWSCQYSKDWLTARMNEGNALAADLWQRYHARYPDTFCGWYWCWEVSNSYIRNMNLMDSRKLLADALRIQTSFLEESGMRLPIMFSPFINRFYGTPKSYAEMWEYVFANSGLKAGDIFCVQDSVGAGGLNIHDLPEWFSELRKAADTLPGLQFWSDTETFDIAHWTAVPIRRFILQMEVVRPYVDNIVTFAYSHYYSPNIVDKGFHRTYLDYLYAGIIDTIIPSMPEKLSVQVLSEKEVRLEWQPSRDNTGICGYYVYRNGEVTANLQTPRQNSGKPAEIPTRMTDDALPESEHTFTYEVRAYDFAGNTSIAAGPVTVIPGMPVIR